MQCLAVNWINYTTWQKHNVLQNNNYISFNTIDIAVADIFLNMI